MDFQAVFQGAGVLEGFGWWLGAQIFIEVDADREQKGNGTKFCVDKLVVL